MTSLNKVILMGGMYKINKLETKSGKSMCTFSIRTYEKFKEKETITFFYCTAYSGIADIIVKYGEDKKQVYIEGRINIYKDKDGLDKFNVIVEDIKFIGSKAA